MSAEARSAKAEGECEGGGSLGAGAAIGERETVRTGPGAHAVLRLADGSVVDVNERTELYVTAVWSGQAIHLQRGDIIVKAAKQRRGHLQVLTRDSVASVKGTVFAVSAGMGGSVVSVVEGSVAVNQPHKDVILSPGQQAASIPALASSVATAVAWSPDATSYLELLGSFVTIERELAKFPAELRTNAALLSSLPAGVFAYGAVPNPGLTVGRVLTLAEDQSAQNPTFAAWWSSETGLALRQMVDRVQMVSPLLGEEIVFSASLGVGLADPVPMVMARVKPGKKAELTNALQALFAEAGEAPGAYSVSDALVVVSSSPRFSGVVARAPRSGRRQPVRGGPQAALPARRGLAPRGRCPAGRQAGGWRRRPAGRVRRHDGDEVPVRRAACTGGCGGERGHICVRGSTNRHGLVAG